jgi:uncharacterized protein YjbJ (UPF0337 family)
MDKARITGSAKEIKGSIKETIGEMTGDTKLQSDGKVDDVEGKVQNAVGGLKDALLDLLIGRPNRRLEMTDRKWRYMCPSDSI